jgi:curved DNA-binding protein
MELPVDIYTAILGGKVELDTFSGRFNINIPKGSQNGKMFRLKNKGMPEYGNENKRGDLYVRVNIKIPENLSKDEIDLFKKLKKIKKQKADAFA